MPIAIARQRTLMLSAAALLVTGVAVVATPAAAQ